MAKWTGGVLTAVGRRLQAKVEAGVTLDLTRIKLGSGTETIDEVDALTDLMAVETSVAISTANVNGEICTVEGILLATTLEHGFWCREFGIYANDPDVGEILYMISVDEEPDWMPADAATDVSVTFAMNIAIANATKITAQIDPTGLVDVDMLNAYTHSVTRQTTYYTGDVLKLPTLHHGLYLECQQGGTTAATLPDVSSMECGDQLTDGTVVWKAKRIMLAPSMAYYYKPEWDYASIGRLVKFGQAVQQTAAVVIAEDGEKYYLGGNGNTVDLDDIILENEYYAGTVRLFYAADKPDQSGYAWIENDGLIGSITNARPTVTFDDGVTISATRGKIIRSDKVYYYVDTKSREPIIDTGDSEYVIATDTEVDEVLDQYFPGNI